MSHEKCPEGHQWYCMKNQGVAGELQEGTRLAPGEVELINQDQNQVNIVCPDGQVVCMRCSRPFIQGDQTVYPNFKDLESRLVGN